MPNHKKHGPPNKRVETRVSPELHEWLAAKAANHGLSINAEIALLLNTMYVCELEENAPKERAS